MVTHQDWRKEMETENKLVRYCNSINELKFQNFTTGDLNMLMSLCYKIKGRDTDSIVISFAEIVDLANYKCKDKERFIHDLKRMSSKLNKVNVTCMNIKGFAVFNLFTAFIADEETSTITVEVNKHFAYLFNELYKDFTRFELEEFVNLQSKYSKNLYRILKQYRTTGKYIVKLDELRDKLDCPVSYDNREFVRNCVNGSVNELSQGYFNNLSVKITRAKKRGNPIEGFVFSFDKENK